MTRGFRHVFRWLLLGVFAAFAAAVLTLAWSALSVARAFDGDAELPVECGLVFGSAVYAGHLPGPAMVRRVSTAARLYREGQVERLVVSGGTSAAGEPTEAAVMRSLALGQWVDARDLEIEDRARSTWENLLFSRPLLADCDGIVAVSDRFHLARIRLLAARQGWEDLMTVGADERPPRGSEWRSLAREVIGYAYYMLRLDHLWNVAPEDADGPGPTAFHMSIRPEIVPQAIELFT